MSSLAAFLAFLASILAYFTADLAAFLASRFEIANSFLWAIVRPSLLLRPRCFLIALEFTETFIFLDFEDWAVIYAMVFDLEVFGFLPPFFSTYGAAATILVNLDVLDLEIF